MGEALKRIVAALINYGSSNHGSMWNCPGTAHEHGDVHKSLSVTQGNSGAVLHCHMGCPADEIAEVIGLSMAELFDEPLEHVSHEVAQYNYCNLDGEILFAKVRYEPKSFSVKHPNGMGWEKGLGSARRVLYRLPEVKRAIALGETVYVVEGEKDCDRLAYLGFTATTNFDGANLPDGKPKWKTDYSDMLAGANVIVIADRDPAGYAHARAVKDSLTGKARTVKIVQPLVEKIGADVSDHLDAGYTVDQLIPIDNEVSKLYKPVDWHKAWKQTPEDVKWLKEPVIEAGTVNALFGKPGVGKSLVTLEIAMEIVRDGGTVMYLDDENRITDTVDRLRAFGCGPDELDRLRLYNFAGLPPLDTGEGGAHLTALAEANEPDLVIIDTTSRMVQGKENDSDTFLQLYRCSLVPLKGRGIAVLRLDHPGKDESRGQRGSSAKVGDIDTLWWLSKDTDTTFALECQKSRSGRVQPGHLVFLTRQFNPLRHDWNPYPDVPVDKTEALIRAMDRVELPAGYGRGKAKEFLREHSIPTVRDDLMSAALARRKARYGVAKASALAVPPALEQSAQEEPEKNWWDD